MKAITNQKTKEIAGVEYIKGEKDDLMKVAILLLEGLSSNVMSPDTWWLSAHAAKTKAVSMGMPVEEFERHYARLRAAIEVNRKANPHHTMF